MTPLEETRAGKDSGGSSDAEKAGALVRVNVTIHKDAVGVHLASRFGVVDKDVLFFGGDIFRCYNVTCQNRAEILHVLTSLNRARLSVRMLGEDFS